MVLGTYPKSYINPHCESNMQPASYDLTLGDSFLVPAHDTIIRMDRPVKYFKHTADKEYPIHPGEFVLGTTIEKIRLPLEVAAFVQGRSSIGRVGLFIENAGWIDPGFSGNITLEIFNATGNTIILIPGRRICQIIFCRTEGVREPYAGKYINQNGVTGSLINEDNNKKTL